MPAIRITTNRDMRDKSAYTPDKYKIDGGIWEYPDIEIDIEFETDHDTDGPSFEVILAKAAANYSHWTNKDVPWINEGDELELSIEDEEKARDKYFRGLQGWGEAVRRNDENNHRDCIS